MSMKKVLSPWVIVVGLLILLALWLIAGYNSFVSAQGAVEGTWAQVETQYQRRADLVPNLVSTVQGAANFEQETFTEVTAARSAWTQAAAAGTRGQQIAAANTFDSALSRLLVTVEAYPQLQATQAFRDLMTQLEGTENRISVARRDYNEAVVAYNIKTRRFPGSLVASIFGFDEEQTFQAEEGSENAPDVNF